MYKVFTCSLLILLYSCSTKNDQSTPSKPTILWESTEGFVHPESVIYSPDSSFYFISNIGNDESNETPDGFISKLDREGKVIDLKWVDSIQSPKGQCITNGKYYVSALDELLEIDLSNGTILYRYSLPEVRFLNDVTADKDGNVYVSGMRENTVYKLTTDRTFELWFQNDSLNHPNGLLAIGNTLYIGGWGNMDENEANIDSVGNLMAINLKTKSFSYVTKNKPGKLDGIQPMEEEQKLLVSSWKAGEVFKMNNEGSYELLLTTPTSIGDILYIPKEKQLIAPLNFQHKVVSYMLP